MDQTAKNRVVIAEDESILRHLLSTLLKSLDYEVVAEASDGRNAIEMVKVHKPDIVCLDINMPEMGGLDALASIKTLNSDVIAIMVTGSSESSEVQQAIRNGADGYLLKPFSAIKLHSAIQKAKQAKLRKKATASE